MCLIKEAFLNNKTGPLLTIRQGGGGMDQKDCLSAFVSSMEKGAMEFHDTQSRYLRMVAFLIHVFMTSF